MAITEPATRQRPRLSLEQREALRPLAGIVLWVTAAGAGVSIALQVIAVAPYPGTADDALLKAAVYLAGAMVISTIFKAIVVARWGAWMEAKLGTNRPVHFRDLAARDIWSDAWWGGVLNGLYVTVFIMLVPVVAGSALTAARVLLFLTLPFLEIRKKILERPTSMRRLIGAAAIAAFGTLLIIAWGAKGVKPLDIGIFVMLLTVGNFFLSRAECHEDSGVHKERVAAGVYTISRFVVYTLTAAAVALVEVLIHPEHSHIVWATIQMCADRWYIVVPLALVNGATDFLRIALKPVESATYMYMIISSSVFFVVVTQTIAKYFDPKQFAFVKTDPLTMIVLIAGVVMIAVGVKLFPRLRATKEEQQY